MGKFYKLGNCSTDKSIHVQIVRRSLSIFVILGSNTDAYLRHAIQTQRIPPAETRLRLASAGLTTDLPLRGNALSPQSIVGSILESSISLH